MQVVSVFVVMRHVHYECGDAIGAAATLERARELAAEAARLVAEFVHPVDGWEQPREDIWTSDLGHVMYEVRRFEVAT